MTDKPAKPPYREVILSIRDLGIKYKSKLGIPGVVDYFSVDIYKGEVLALVSGETSSGKSTVGRAILRMVEPHGKITGGRILYKGQDLISMPTSNLLQIRGSQIAYLNEEPRNPSASEQLVIDALKVHKPKLTPQEMQSQTAELVNLLGLNAPRDKSTWQQLCTNLAGAMKAQIVIADEPTAPLVGLGTKDDDFADLLLRIQRRLGFTLIVVTRLLDVAQKLADRALVMYKGRIAEVGDNRAVFEEMRHPYSEIYVKKAPLKPLDEVVKGCRFHPRCPHVMENCKTQQPFLMRLDDPTPRGVSKDTSEREKHLVACWLYQEKK